MKAQNSNAETTGTTPRLILLPNSIRFVLPTLPLSVNALYRIIYSERRVELKPEARKWKTEAKRHMPPWRPQSTDSLICVDVVFHYDFHCKNGSLRKVDTHNMMKLLIDAVAERYGFRDERVKQCPIDSHHSKQERAVVTVSEYNLVHGGGHA